MSEEKPEDFIFNAIPRSKREAVAADAEARVTETVKGALQSYLSLFLAPDGIHRRLLNLTAGFSVQFETRIRGARDSEDPTIFDVQLAKYWGDLRQRLPCIILVDTGFEYENPGLGGITDSWPININTSSVQLTMLANVPMDLQIAAMDETTCGDIRDILVYILGPLSHVNKGHVVRSKRPEDKWEVRIPLDFQPSGLERRAVNNDPKDGMWTTTISLTPVFEGLIRVGFANQIHPEMHKIISGFDERIPIGFRLDTGQAVPLSEAPSIDMIKVPSTVRLSQHAVIEAPWIPARASFITDNPRIALIDQRTGAIIPKRLGDVAVKLIQESPGFPNGPKILRSWNVKVIPS